MAQDIGYMQVQFKIYRDGELYDSCAINAFDECFQVITDRMSSEHRAIDDPAGGVEKCVQVTLKMFVDEYSIALLIPVHQSKAWESVVVGDQYIVGFYCIVPK